MTRRTPLYQAHVDAGAHLVDVGGWDMPLHYGSQIEEYAAVRTDAGMFDGAHLGIIDVVGARAREFLRRLLANDVDKLKSVGRTLYSCMLNPSGGVIDDLIVHRMQEFYRLVVNAANRVKDLAWIREQSAPFEVSVAERKDLTLIAVQGPYARAKVEAVLPPLHRSAAARIEPYAGAQLGSWFLARSHYTGEEGYEIMLPVPEVAQVWDELALQGVVRAGLGARNCLRLEAGMNLYGHDMDEDHHPLESGLAWTVAFSPADRDFIGRKALEAVDVKFGRELVGLVLARGGEMRSRQLVVLSGSGVGTIGADELIFGEITSSTFSPTLNCSIALARLNNRTQRRTVQVAIGGRLRSVRVVKPPFVRHGKAMISL